MVHMSTITLHAIASHRCHGFAWIKSDGNPALPWGGRNVSLLSLFDILICCFGLSLSQYLACFHHLAWWQEPPTWPATLFPNMATESTPTLRGSTSVAGPSGYQLLDTIHRKASSRSHNDDHAQWGIGEDRKKCWNDAMSKMAQGGLYKLEPILCESSKLCASSTLQWENSSGYQGSPHCPLGCPRQLLKG